MYELLTIVQSVLLLVVLFVLLAMLIITLQHLRLR